MKLRVRQPSLNKYEECTLQIVGALITNGMFNKPNAQLNITDLLDMSEHLAKCMIGRFEVKRQQDRELNEAENSTDNS